MPSLTTAVTPCAGVPATLLVAAAAMGVAASQRFALQNTRVLNYFTKGTYSVCTVDLERSIDGGTTWVTMNGQTGIDIAGVPNGTFDCPTGVVYRLNVKTFTGTSVTLIGCVDQ